MVILMSIDNKIELSIISPVYKVELYIDKFIDSILIQSERERFELILIDDCGGDKSIEIAKSKLSNSSIKYQIVHHKTNRGVSVARNSGLDAANGTYIYWADSDDVLEENTVKYLFDAIKEYPNQKIFYFNAKHRNIGDTDLREWEGTKDIQKEMSASNFLKLMYEGKVGAYLWVYLFHKEVFSKIRFQEGSVWEDAIIFPFVLSNLSQIVCYTEWFIYQYILRSASITQSVHPQIGEVVSGLNKLEYQLYPLKSEKLYDLFVLYRTSLTMRLSRECFVRGTDYRKNMEIHKNWGKFIPFENVKSLWNNGKKKSAVFLLLIKNNPSILFLLYKIKILK